MLAGETQRRPDEPRDVLRALGVVVVAVRQQDERDAHARATSGGDDRLGMPVVERAGVDEGGLPSLRPV